MDEQTNDGTNEREKCSGWFSFPSKRIKMCSLTYLYSSVSLKLIYSYKWHSGALVSQFLWGSSEINWFMTLYKWTTKQLHLQKCTRTSPSAKQHDYIVCIFAHPISNNRFRLKGQKKSWDSCAKTKSTTTTTKKPKIVLYSFFSGKSYLFKDIQHLFNLFISLTWILVKASGHIFKNLCKCSILIMVIGLRLSPLFDHCKWFLFKKKTNSTIISILFANFLFCS